MDHYHNNNGNGNQDYSVSETFEFSITIGNQDTFTISGINGAIDITGSATATTVEIWGEKIVKSFSTLDAEAHLDELEVQVSSHSNEVNVQTNQPRDTDGRSYEVVYHVRLHSYWRVGVNNINGGVDVDSIHNKVTVDLTNGGVVLTDIQGDTDVDVVNGQIIGRIALPLSGSCRFGTVNGQVVLNIPEETTADLSASVTNGSIQISGLELQDLQISPRSVDGVLGDGNGSICLTTVNGTISVNGY